MPNPSVHAVLSNLRRVKTVQYRSDPEANESRTFAHGAKATT